VVTRILALSLLTSFAVAPRALAAEADAPWVGTWRLNPSRSTARPGPTPYRRTTLRIEQEPDGLTVSYDMVGMRGGRTHIEWSGQLDGRDYPVQGVDYVMTNAYRLVDPRSYEITVRLDGRLVATTRVTVSPDGQSLTAVTTERDGRDQTGTATAVYDRH
jgi:hypothetical protein